MIVLVPEVGTDVFDDTEDASLAPPNILLNNDIVTLFFRILNLLKNFYKPAVSLDK